MLRELNGLGMKNVVVMPNFKRLTIVETDSLVMPQITPMKVCTFSRVTEDKGIPDAAAAVLACNKAAGKEVISLDIYGRVDNESWFRNFMKDMPKSVQYKGCVASEESVNVLCEYALLLFPTYYPGECFAGTLIDAMAAGIPVIASDWHSNAELVVEGKTGFIVPTHDVQAIQQKLWTFRKMTADEIMRMKQYCVEYSQLFRPEIVIKTLISRMA